MTESYSITTDFGGSVSISQLDQEIQDSSIVTSLLGINRYGDTIDIVFSSTISTGEKTTLDGIVSAHTPVTTASFTPFSVYPARNTYRSSIYSRVASHKFYGTSYSIYSISIFSFMRSDVTSYDIRVLNISDNSIIATGNFSNTAEDYLDLGTISNIPTVDTEIEVHVKKNGGSYVSVLEVIFNLTNK